MQDVTPGLLVRVFLDGSLPLEEFERAPDGSVALGWKRFFPTTAANAFLDDHERHIRRRG